MAQLQVQHPISVNTGTTDHCFPHIDVSPPPPFVSLESITNIWSSEDFKKRSGILTHGDELRFREWGEVPWR